MKKMIRTIFLLLTIALSADIYGQVFVTRTGRIDFDATTRSSPERVEARNNEVACIVDAKTGEVRFQAPIKSFKFERALMQEHFNENYMESDKYPKADFRGAIANPADVNFAKDGEYRTKVSGKLTIHGATNEVSVPGTVTVKGNTIDIRAKFVVKLADYKISVPSVVADKLDKNATITVDALLTQK